MGKRRGGQRRIAAAPRDDRAQVVSVSLPPGVLADLDDLTEQMGYRSRSEALRDALRSFFHEAQDLEGMGDQVEGTVSIYYLSSAVSAMHRVRHAHDAIVRSTLSSHFHRGGPSCCVDVLVVAGAKETVQRMLSELRVIKGVDVVRFIPMPPMEGHSAGHDHG